MVGFCLFCCTLEDSLLILPQERHRNKTDAVGILKHRIELICNVPAGKLEHYSSDAFCLHLPDRTATRVILPDTIYPSLKLWAFAQDSLDVGTAETRHISGPADYALNKGGEVLFVQGEGFIALPASLDDWKIPGERLVEKHSRRYVIPRSWPGAAVHAHAP